MMRYQQHRIADSFVCLLSVLVLSGGCSTPEPSPIQYGQDNCAYCNMTIVDQRFGSELVTPKGKVLKFDAIECLAAHVAEAHLTLSEMHSLWVTDFTVPAKFMNVAQSSFVHTARMRSPMGMGLFGFSSAAAARSFADANEGTLVDWEGVLALVRDTWLKEP